MYQAIESTLIVRPIHRERLGSLYVPDIGKPSTHGQVVSSGVEWAPVGSHILHQPWARYIPGGSEVLWLLDAAAIVAVQNGESWQMRPGWCLVEVDQGGEKEQGGIVLIEGKTPILQAAWGRVVAGPWAGERVAWYQDEGRRVALWSSGREWQAVPVGDILARETPPGVGLEKEAGR